MQPGARHPAAEPRGGGVLEAVRLVEDDGVVLRQHAGLVEALAHPEVGEVERVVGDHEIGSLGACACGLGEAGADERAATSEAALRADRELAPEGVGRLERKLRAIAGLRRLDPFPQLLEGTTVLRALEERSAEQLEAVHALPAEVVLPALENSDVDLAAEGGGGQRHVLRQQLLLQRLRRRRDHDAEPRLQRRDEVRKALPRSRARLGEQMLAAGERPGDSSSKLLLLGPRLVTVEDGREPPSRTKYVRHGSQSRDRGGRP